MGSLAALLLCSVAACVPQGDDVDRSLILHARRSDDAGSATVPVLASVPFARGAVHALDALTVADVRCPARALIRWEDGSIAVAQVRVPVRADTPAGTRLRVGRVDAAPSAAESAGVPSTRFDGELPLRSVVVDPWGREFAARFVPDPTAGVDGWLVRDAVVCVRRFVARHVDGDGAGFLGLRAYLVAFPAADGDGSRRAELTVVLDNDLERGAHGPVRLHAWRLESRGTDLRFLPRLRRENLLPPPTPRAATADDTGWVQTLLGPSDHLYLGDRTGKAFRFDLFLDREEARADDDERATARWIAAAQPRLVPAVDWVRATRAFGAHGGPAPTRATAAEAADGNVDATGAVAWLAWTERAEFGPFGAFGDALDPAASGASRAGPSALHGLLRWRRAAALATAAEAMVLQQTLRPTPGRVTRLPAATAAWRGGLPRVAFSQPHGFVPLDYEHFSVDLVYDWYWLTGDPLARDELARLGRGLERILAGLPFRTSRGEGWSLQAGVLIARALENPGLRDRLLQRWRTQVAATPLRPHVAIPQPPHADALGTAEEFDAPWQMAALVHGLHALWQATGADDVARDLVTVARAIARAGWRTGVGPVAFVAVRDPNVTRLPIAHHPLEGAAWAILGAMVLAEECATGDDDRSLFRSRADELMAGYLSRSPAERDVLATNPWFQLRLDRTETRR